MPKQIVQRPFQLAARQAPAANAAEFSVLRFLECPNPIASSLQELVCFAVLDLGRILRRHFTALDAIVNSHPALRDSGIRQVLAERRQIEAAFRLGALMAVEAVRLSGMPCLGLAEVIAGSEADSADASPTAITAKARSRQFDRLFCRCHESNQQAGTLSAAARVTNRREPPPHSAARTWLVYPMGERKVESEPGCRSASYDSVARIFSARLAWYLTRSPVLVMVCVTSRRTNVGWEYDTYASSSEGSGRQE